MDSTELKRMGEEAERAHSLACLLLDDTKYHHTYPDGTETTFCPKDAIKSLATCVGFLLSERNGGEDGTDTDARGDESEG